MTKRLNLRLLLLVFTFCFGGSAYAETLEEVVVTGSYIKGTPEDAALPVDVLNRDDLEEVGNPTLIEMVRNLGVTSGNLGETNQFDTRGGQGNEGVVTANLRGLGPARTLVLINKKRHVATETIGVDIGAIPGIAIGRVEILKDGAAANYGSDAIGGVINFITRDNFEGFEIRASHMDIQDSDGDTEFGLIYGGGTDDVNWVISAEFSERSELRIRDRDWALRPFPENPAPGGWSSIGNPGSFFRATSTGTLLSGFNADPGCETLGGFLGPGPRCFFQYTWFDNLVEDEESTKIFAELNGDINDNLSFHVEMLWHEMNMDEWKTSPSYPPQALLGADRLVLPSHPGLIDLKAQNPGLFPETAGVPGSAQGAFTWSRMLGVAGRNGEPESAGRYTDTRRFSGGFEGELDNGISFDTSLTWSRRDRDLGGSDMFIERMAFALKGLGGAGCNPSTGTPGVGPCEYYNPFSNAIQFSPVSGATNPQYNAAVANSDELINHLTASTGSFTENSQLVFETIFSGESGMELSGGNVGWAAGVQYRRDKYDFQVLDVANRRINPCPFTDPAALTFGFTSNLDCGNGGAGQLAFLAATDEENTSRKIYAVFAEVALPISDTFDMQLAARYEDYGEDDGGDSFDPKVAFSWSPTDEFKIRGSASTTFRGPAASTLSGTATALAFVTPALAFKAVDTTGNPGLEPETAVTLNLGAIYQTGNFYGSIDYWSFDFEDPFQLENANQIVNAYGEAECFDGGAGVGSAECNILRGRLTPDGTSVGGVQRIQRFVINGSDIQLSGLDFVGEYVWDDVANGELSVGINGTYNLEYESDDFILREGIVVKAGGDFVGKSNESTPFNPLPELKSNLFIKWGNDQHKITYTARMIDGYTDEATDTPATLREIDNHQTHDVTYINNMIDNLTISLSVFNFTDEDPPQVANDLNYDPYNHNPFGRMVKLGVTYQFGQE